MAHAHLTARSLDVLLGHWRGRGSQYQALADRIRLLVLDGRIPADTRLPAERDLAGHLGLSRTTVAAAYRELRESDFLQSVRGSGSLTRLPGPERAPAQPFGGEGMLDFTKAALPAATSLPSAARAAAEELPRFLSDSGYDPVGLPHLREAIAERYRQRGLPTAADQVLVTVGAQQAIALVARTFLRRGDRAVIEMPSYPHGFEALRLAGARLVPITVSAPSVEDGPHDDGWNADTFEQIFSRASPKLAYVIPDFHNPTGASMLPATRERLLAAAAEQGTIVVADETTAELDIDRVGEYLPLAAYRAEGVDTPVVLIGSASKILWGGLRIGWIRANRAVIAALLAAKPAADLGTPILDQLVVAQMLPQLTSIVEERRSQLRVGRQAVRSQLAVAFPEWTLPDPRGGLAVWVSLGSSASSALALNVRQHGLLIAAGPRFGLGGTFERFVRIPMTHDEAETVRAVAALSQSWPTSLGALDVDASALSLPTPI